MGLNKDYQRTEADEYQVDDDDAIQFGTDDDFEWVFNSAESRIELVNNSTTNTVLAVDTADDVVDILGGVNMNDVELDMNSGNIRLTGFEGNDYLFGGNISDSEVSGVKIETLTNPASGDPIFIVESSGASERLRVEHDGVLSTSNSDIEANGNTVIHQGNQGNFDAANFGGSSGTSGQFLQTDGSNTSWADVSGGAEDAAFSFYTGAVQVDSTSYTELNNFSRMYNFDRSPFSGGVFEAVLNITNEGTAEGRARDITNSSTIGSVSTTNTSPTRLTDTSLSNLSSAGDVSFESRINFGFGEDTGSTEVRASSVTFNA